MAVPSKGVQLRVALKPVRGFVHLQTFSTLQPIDNHHESHHHFSIRMLGALL
jgi:hypothetical protein